ncbi:MAG: glycosyltransferase family 4 protein [Desulfobacterales bacterium]|nr:glycosyltransferase family 4 protein [Desulfobacterales bacterium]MDJ0887485.1 glycosyltransferase family 4 protein [Desulfobacterales bacterium]MDJ0991329.1 glycosyltransferase family 4 protein [Desulfobacterales bacterium]
MSKTTPKKKLQNVGIISTRIAGTDGVSLEIEKWAHVLEGMGLACYYFAGELDRPEEQSYFCAEAHFTHPAIKEVYLECFDLEVRKRDITDKLHALKNGLKDHLYAFVAKFDLGLIVIENALTIPLNVPLGVAITEFIAETGIPTIAHHHDFYWERDRFTNNAIGDYLSLAFPPNLPGIYHVVINSHASAQLSLRTGISAVVSPNVMDFDFPPAPPDEYVADVRQALGLADDELLVLQPTRVVQRKGIEHAIELVSRLDMKAKLVISHASGDEGYDYEMRLREYSQMMGVETLFVANVINEHRGLTKDGRKIYTLEDIYPHADLVTYPSTFEGFGNAFLEAIYFRKPIVVNNYSIYHKDIKPKGFQVIEIDGYVTEEAVQKTRWVLTDERLRKRMVETNYKLGKQFFSFAVLQRQLEIIIRDYHWNP